MSLQTVGPRIRRTIVATAVAGGVMAVTAMPAAAGGWWTSPQLEHSTLAIGESTTVSADLMFASVDAAKVAAGSGEYFAYLVRGIDEAGLQEAMSTAEPGRDWWTAPTGAIQLAPLTLDGRDSNLGGAAATFVVPDVEPGIFDVMLCDRGCSQALADVVPLRDVYVGDPVTVRLLRDAGLETQHLLDQFGSMRSQLDRLNDQTGTLSDTLDDLDQRLEDQATEGHRLTASLATLETRIAEGERPAPALTPWWIHAGWFLGGAGLAAAWMRRRRGAMDEVGHDRDGRAASPDVDGARPSPPELVTWEQDRGSQVR